MDRIGEKTYLPYLNIEESDAAIIVGLPVVLFLAGAFLTEVFAIPAALVGVFVGVAIVKAAPRHLTAATWLRDLLEFYIGKPRVFLHTPADSDDDASQGGLAEYRPFVPDERTQDLTGLERAWAGAGAVQRQDDAVMEAWLELHPANMDFAMSEDWAQLQESARQFANDELDFSITFHATTRPFPAKQMVDTLDRRRQDPDVQHNPVFGELIDEYREQRPADLRNVNQLHYYIGVEVSQTEVYERYEGDKTPLERMAEIPIMGTIVFERFVSRREDLSEATVRDRMFEKLDARTRRLETGLVNSFSGCGSTRLSTVEIFLLNMDFWNGQDHASQFVTADAEELLPSEAVSASKARDDAAIIEEARSQ